MLVFSVRNVLKVLTVHTGEALFLAVFFRVLTVFTAIVEGVYFAWYAVSDRFDSFGCYGFVLGILSVLTV